MTDSQQPPATAPVLSLVEVDVPAPDDPSTTLVYGVNWQVHTGECWLLEGPPGTGKTAVLQVAAALVRPARGTLRLFGADVARLSEADLLGHRSRIGVVFGDGGRLFAQLTLLENVALPLLYHHPHPSRERLARLEHLIESLGLAPYTRHLPRVLPRAIAGRAALARALVLQPDILLLDDPGSGTPHEELEWWRRWVTETRRQNPSAPSQPHTLVIATQNPRPWRDLATHSALLTANPGRLLPGPVLRPNATT